MRWASFDLDAQRRSGFRPARGLGHCVVAFPTRPPAELLQERFVRPLRWGDVRIVRGNDPRERRMHAMHGISGFEGRQVRSLTASGTSSHSGEADPDRNLVFPDPMFCTLLPGGESCSSPSQSPSVGHRVFAQCTLGFFISGGRATRGAIPGSASGVLLDWAACRGDRAILAAMHLGGSDVAHGSARSRSTRAVESSPSREHSEDDGANVEPAGVRSVGRKVTRASR